VPDPGRSLSFQAQIIQTALRTRPTDDFCEKAGRQILRIETPFQLSLAA
jgi:hypothetical protein